MSTTEQATEAADGQSRLTEVLERRIVELADWFSDNPNTSDIDDGIRCLVRDAIFAERMACAMVCESTMAEVVHGGNKDYNTGREMGATICANKIRMRSNAQ